MTQTRTTEIWANSYCPYCKQVEKQQCINPESKKAVNPHAARKHVYRERRKRMHSWLYRK